MSQLFQRKPIAALVEDTQGEQSLKRSLGAGDLIMLAIGAVIGGCYAAGKLDDVFLYSVDDLSEIVKGNLQVRREAVVQAEAMIAEVRGAALLASVRSAPAADVGSVVACLEALADFAQQNADVLDEVDLNPIKVLERGAGCRIVDALIVPRKETERNAEHV